MKVKGLQNWIGIVSFALLVVAIALLFTNWMVYDDDPIPRGEWREYYFSGDPEEERVDVPAYGLFYMLETFANRGFGPFGVTLYMIAAALLLYPVGEGLAIVIMAWIVIVLFATLSALFIKLIIQRIFGKKAKGILACVFYGLFMLLHIGINEAAWGFLTPWGFVGFAAILASIILWTIYCRKMGITRKSNAPAMATPYYNYGPVPQASMPPVAAPAMHCGQCGAQLLAGTTFCGRCGAQIQAMQPPVYQQPAQPYPNQQYQQPNPAEQHQQPYQGGQYPPQV